jgi:SHS2 domain-containing protein
MPIPYEIIDHTADLGIAVRADTRETIYVNTGLAMFDLLVDGPLEKEGPSQQIEVTGADAADLMVNWLRELLYLWAGEEKVVNRIRILSLVEEKLIAEVFWESFDQRIHCIRNEIKAVTYHQIHVDRSPSGFEARVIFDI